MKPRIRKHWSGMWYCCQTWHDSSPTWVAGMGKTPVAAYNDWVEIFKRYNFSYTKDN